MMDHSQTPKPWVKPALRRFGSIYWREERTARTGSPLRRHLAARGDRAEKASAKGFLDGVGSGAARVAGRARISLMESGGCSG